MEELLCQRWPVRFARGVRRRGPRPPGITVRQPTGTRVTSTGIAAAGGVARSVTAPTVRPRAPTCRVVRERVPHVAEIVHVHLNR